MQITCAAPQSNRWPADGSAAVGLLTVLTFSEICAELAAAGVDAAALDFLVCNGGAYLFYMGLDGEWLTDETWEAKVAYRWDKKLVVRTHRAGHTSSSSSWNDVWCSSVCYSFLLSALVVCTGGARSARRTAAEPKSLAICVVRLLVPV